MIIDLCGPPRQNPKAFSKFENRHILLKRVCKIPAKSFLKTVKDLGQVQGGEA